MWYVVLGGLVVFALVVAGLRLPRQTQLIEDEEYRAAAIVRLDEVLRTWRRRAPHEIAAADCWLPARAVAG